MRKAHLIDKQLAKRAAKKCTFCPESDYDVLDVHRIIEGKDGGKYTEHNTVVACACCHRRIHAGDIRIIGKFYCTAGRYVVNYVENGQEKFA
jgi:hypothetical protein